VSSTRRGGRHTTTIILVALAGAAATWLFVAEKGRVTTEERQARHGRVFTAWRGDDVEKIAIVSSQGSFTVVRRHPDERDDRSFSIESSEGVAPADPQSVDQILSTLDLATFRREVPKGSVDRSAMGLDAPKVRIEIVMGDLTARLTIGNDAPAESGVYAEVDGDRVIVVAATLAKAIDVGEGALRDKKLVPYASPDLAKITLAGASVARFERATWPASRGTAFRLEGGGPRVDARAFRDVVEGLGSLAADVLIEGESAPDEAKVVITLTPKEGPDAVLALGAPCPGHADLVVAARRAPTKLVGCVAADAITAFLRPRTAFEDRHIVGTSRDELIEVKVSASGQTLEMARRGTGFFVRKPEEQSVPDVAARGFVDALIGATGDLESVAAKDLDGDGAATLRVISRPVAEGDPERIETLQIGPIKAGKRAIRREEDGAGLWVAETAVRPLLVGELVLRDRKIIDVPAEKVREVAVLEPGTEQRVRRAGSAIELVQPRGTGLVADEQWGRELLDRSAQLEAMRWLASADDGSFDLAPPRATIEIRIEDQLGKPESERTVRIALGARGDDGTFAQVVGKPEVFLAPPEIEAAAMRPLIDRGAFSVRTADVKRLLVRAGTHAPFELEKRDGALLAVVSGSKGALSRASRIRDGLDDLVAITAVAVGDAKKEQGLDAPVLTLEVTPIEGRPYRVVVGAADVLGGSAIHYARRSDVDATFAVAPSGVRTLVEALR